MLASIASRRVIGHEIERYRKIKLNVLKIGPERDGWWWRVNGNAILGRMLAKRLDSARYRALMEIVVVAESCRSHALGYLRKIAEWDARYPVVVMDDIVVFDAAESGVRTSLCVQGKLLGGGWMMTHGNEGGRRQERARR